MCVQTALGLNAAYAPTCLYALGGWSCWSSVSIFWIVYVDLRYFLLMMTEHKEEEALRST